MPRQTLITLLAKLVTAAKLLQDKLDARVPKDLRPLVARKRDALIAAALKAGMPIRVTEGVRSCSRQNELYAQGRTTPGRIVTNARCGESMHQYGVAFDVVFRNTGYEGDWRALGAMGKKLGLEWGGDWVAFVDRPHFQLTLGYSLDDFNNGRVDYSKFQ